MGERSVVGPLVVPGVGALLAAGLGWAVGLDAGHIVLLALTVLLVGGAARTLGSPAEPAWDQDADDSSGTGCHLVPLQARMVHECEGDRERFERLLAPRLRRLAAGRLHAAGYGLADAGVRELLGPALFDPLRPGRAPRRAAAYVTRLLDRLDELDPPHAVRPGPTGPTTPGTRPDTRRDPRREDTAG